MAPERDRILTLIRQELGGIRSCALLLANASAGEVRGRYLKSLNEKLKSVEQLLAELPLDRSAAS